MRMQATRQKFAEDLWAQVHAARQVLAPHCYGQTKPKTNGDATSAAAAESRLDETYSETGLFTFVADEEEGSSDAPHNTDGLAATAAAAGTSSRDVGDQVPSCFACTPREVGRGSFSRVLEGSARARFDGDAPTEPAAVKVVDITLFDQDALQRCVNEAAMLLQTPPDPTAAVEAPELTHSAFGVPPHRSIVRVLDAAVCDGRWLCVAMQRLSGVALTLACLRHQLPPRSDAALASQLLRCVLRDVFGALAHLHKHGVVHRDIKPGNIVLVSNCPRDSPPVAVLIDFGSAAAIGSARVPSEALSPQGSPAFMAPEACVVPGDGGVVGSGAEDVWSVGVLGTVLATGRTPYPPFERQYPHLILNGYRAGTTFDGKSFGPCLATAFSDTNEDDAPLTLRDLIAKCLTINPDERLTAAKALEHPYFLVG